jgi:hypothetical protein
MDRGARNVMRGWRLRVTPLWAWDARVHCVLDAGGAEPTADEMHDGARQPWYTHRARSEPLGLQPGQAVCGELLPSAVDGQ